MNKTNLDNIIKSAKKFEIESQKLFRTFEGNPHQITFLNETIPNIESLQDEDSKKFLREATGCFEREFYRAAIVLAWCVMIASLRNICVQYPNYIKASQFPKSDPEKIREKYRDSDLIRIMYDWHLINKDIHDVLIRLLNERNMAAHPSSKDPNHISTLAFIDKVVNNIKEIYERLEKKSS